jgi:ribonuclease HI
MAMQTDIRRYGARPVIRQAVTVPGPEPQRGPPSTSGGANQGGRQQQRPASKPCQSLNSAVSLVFAQWNAEGLRKKKPELQEFLRREQVDIICIQETHLTDAHRFSVRGYELFRHDRSQRSKGGIVTLVRNSIPAIEIGRSTGDNEFLAVRAVLQDKEITVINVYCPPDKDLQLHTLPLTDNNLLITGDFNGHSPSWGYQDLNSRGEEIEDWMIDNNLLLINRPEDKPTCLSRAWKTTSTPDLAIATEDIEKICDRQVKEQLGGSDHLPVLLTLSITDPVQYHRHAPSWNYKKANWSKFQASTNSLCNERRFDKKNDINTNVQQFTECILEAAKQSIPRGRRKNYKPYWNQKLQDLHDHLTTTREQLEKTPNTENTTAYNRARAAFDEEKIKEIRNSWQEKTSSLNLEKDTGKLWKLTKSLNDDHQHTPRATLLKEEGNLYTGKKAAFLLAENFSEDSLLDVPQDQTRDIRQRTKEALRKSTPSESMTADFTIDELNHSIRQLKKKKAPGKDKITNEMIKNLGTFAKQELLNICNQSWNTGEFPSLWKEAIIAPILKKGKDRHSKTSYRPISLLSCLGKTMERMVNRRLQHHLEKNGLLNPAQSGFRKNRNTEDQVTLLTQDIENGFQEKMKTLAVFVDLTKAFDKVWKEGLLLKLLHKQVCGKMYWWIHSYLFHRTARVKLDRQTSAQVKIREGVPQGGVISPTLFMIFIDDITRELSRHISRALHADDLAIWTKGEHVTTATCRMQEALNKVDAWAQEWMVTINRTKTEATCFSLSTKKEQFSLKINGEDVPQQDTTKYLGVTLDKRLTWTPHINTMQGKAVKRMAVMKKLAGTRWGANTRILTQVYTGSVRPHMEYASNAWSTAAQSNSENLNKVQNASMRLITGAMKTTPIAEMEKMTGLLSLQERRDEKLLRQSEKMKRLPTHPLHSRLQDLTKNRIKRKSPNHAIKALQQKHSQVLPRGAPSEHLQDYEDWSLGTPNIILNIPGVGAKEEHSEIELKSLTLEALDKNYPATTWTRAYTDGSAEDAVRNGGGGIFIKFPDGNSISRSVATGQHSTNFRAEASALLTAAQTLNQKDRLPGHTVILTDCRSLLQSLQHWRSESILQHISQELQTLSSKTSVVLQWIPSHCGVAGNEEADRLSKAGSKMPQAEHQLSYAEAKTILRSHFRDTWRQRLQLTSETDSIHQLDRAQQVTIFRLRTGHCQLLSHLYRLKIAHTDQCPCGTGSQTASHILQSCPTFHTLRCQTWPSEVDLHEKLWGPAVSLGRTVDFIMQAGLTV